jgi:pyrroline-5-carboxylate reductase
MKVGIIGYGNMASSMLEGLLRSGVLSSTDVVVSSRTASRMSPLAERWPDVETTVDNRLAASRSQVLFVCVRSEQAKEVVESIRPSLSPSAHVVLINGGVRLSDLRGSDIRFSKVIPTVTAEVGKGVTLMHHGDNVTDEQRDRLERMFSAVGTVKVIDEDRFDVGTSMTSCGPAFVATFIEEFAKAAASRGGYSYEESLAMVTETVLATAALMSEGRNPALICRAVATEGGITERGLNVMRSDLPTMLDMVMDAILSEHRRTGLELGGH